MISRVKGGREEGRCMKEKGGGTERNEEQMDEERGYVRDRQCSPSDQCCVLEAAAAAAALNAETLSIVN